MGHPRMDVIDLLPLGQVRQNLGSTRGLSINMNLSTLATSLSIHRYEYFQKEYYHSAL